MRDVMRWGGGFGVLVGLVLALAVGGCQDRGKDEQSVDVAIPTPGGTAVVALPDEPDVLNPLVRTSSMAGMVLSLMSSSLVEMSPELLWEPEIAESWSVAADSLSITYKLRPWRWSDGEALTSADVALSWRLIVDPRVGSPRASLLRDIVDVETPDPETVRYRFDRPVADPIQASFHSILPAHLVAELDPARQDLWPLNRDNVSSGPFRLVSWDAGEQLVLERNPHYLLHRAYLDRLVLRVMPDATAQMLALESGEVDLVMGVTAATARRLEGNADIAMHEVSGRVFGFVLWNLRQPQLRQPAVRRALSLAIDRQRFVDDLLSGLGRPATSYLPPVLWNHHAGLAPDPFSPDSARTLLATAGWVDTDGDGVRDRDGQPLTMEVLYRSGNSVRDNGAVVLQQNLSDVGVRVELRALELATALEFLRDGRFGAYWGEFQANLYADPSALIHSASVDQFNFGCYGNARVDSLLTAALATADRDVARPVWWELQEELVLDPPAALIYYPQQLVATSVRLRDAHPDMLSALNNIHRWWIAPADRRWAAADRAR